KWMLIGGTLFVTPACFCDSELCRVGGGGAVAIGSGSSSPSQPMSPPVVSTPGVLSNENWQVLQHLAWPQSQIDIRGTFGTPLQVEAANDIYGIPGGRKIAIVYQGDQATGYIFWSEEDQNVAEEYDPTAYELHGAVTEADCWKMLSRFQTQGRRVNLVAVVRTNNKGAVLKYQCVFDGEDANPVEPPFEDRRYNSPDEYAL
ncbi:MAG: hypothetical protein F6K42_38080, partial [Leptolyngbya sp. SIO1D8]|nr:hypothetical protein [Leptolyngbya sp. SIO1D8]